MSTSGWWPARSAAVATSRANRAAPSNDPARNVASMRPRRNRQSGRSPRSWNSGRRHDVSHRGTLGSEPARCRRASPSDLDVVSTRRRAASRTMPGGRRSPSSNRCRPRPRTPRTTAPAAVDPPSHERPRSPSHAPLEPTRPAGRRHPRHGRASPPSAGAASGRRHRPAPTTHPVTVHGPQPDACSSTVRPGRRCSSASGPRRSRRTSSPSMPTVTTHARGAWPTAATIDAVVIRGRRR